MWREEQFVAEYKNKSYKYTRIRRLYYNKTCICYNIRKFKIIDTF